MLSDLRQNSEDPTRYEYTWEQFVAAAKVAPIEGLTRDPHNSCLLASTLRVLTGWDAVNVGMTCGFPTPDGFVVDSIYEDGTTKRVSDLIYEFLDEARAYEREIGADVTEMPAPIPVERVRAVLVKHGIERED
jgi:hypothetical protein